MRVLVTGHEGYIGTVLAPLLRNAGHEVVGLDTGMFTRGNLGPLPMQIQNLDVDSRDVKVSQLEGFDAVIHLAGLSNDPLGDLNPQCTFEINHSASVRLAALAKQAGVPRFLFASSCSLYGAASELDVLDESAPFNPVTPYGSSKIMVEKDVSKMADDAFSPTFLRCATAYGASPRLRADLVVNNLTGYALLKGEVLLKSDGTPWRPLVHIEDISRAYLAVLEAPRELIHNEAFNVGRSTENYQMREVAEIVQQVVPGSEIRLADGASPDTRCYRVDCSKLEQTLPAYRPRWTVRDGVEELYQAYKDFELTLEDFLGPKYMRIRQIRALQEEGRLDASLRWLTKAAKPAVPADARYQNTQQCRACSGHRLVEILSLGKTPLADRLLTEEQMGQHEPRFPLTVLFCRDCALLQIRETVASDLLFGEDYPHYSSFSERWLTHCRNNALELMRTRRLRHDSLVIELASNDGYMLKNFASQGIPVLGIDPVPGPAAAAEQSGVMTLVEFFTNKLAGRLRAQGVAADVVIANNVLGDVPDLPDFVQGIRQVLKDDGVAVIECPYVKNLVERCGFDTFYHEHHCYFSVSALSRLFASQGLYLTDVRQSSTHGGSLRLYVEKRPRTSDSVEQCLIDERQAKVDRLDYYQDFAAKVQNVRTELVELLRELKRSGKTIAAYAAAARGAALLNYAGIDRELIDYVVDRNRQKRGKYVPGVHLPVEDTTMLLKRRPDYVLLLALNHKDEILKQQKEYLRQGGRFIVPLPQVEVITAPQAEPVAASPEGV